MSQSVLPASLDNLCRELLRQVVGSRAVITQIGVLSQQLDYWVLRIQLEHPESAFILKLAGNQAALASDFDRTAALHRLIASNTLLPVAEVLAADTSCRVYPWRYLLKTYIAGEEWKDVRSQLDAAEQQKAYQQIGAAVAQIHSITFSAFGELNEAALPTGSKDYLPSLRQRAARSIRNPRLLEQLLQLVADQVSLFAGVDEACLCHEDLHHRNLIFRKNGTHWELATVLDFEKAWAGHHEIDLARLEFWDGMVENGFWEAYSAYRHVDAYYEQRRLIYQLLWCFEYARTTPRHLADTHRLCVQLGLSPFTSFDD